MKLPVPRWQLVQVGLAKAPRYNSTTEMTFSVAESTIQLHSGATYDFFRNSRATFTGGTFRHGGMYRTEFVSQANVWPVSEVDLIQSQKGIYAPILFAKDYTSSQPCQDCCFIVPNCWLFAWAYGKVKTVTNTFTTDDYSSPEATEVSIEGVLESPLKEVTYATWRYGTDLIAEATERKLLRSELELAQAETKRQWWIPCELPSPKTDNRFWPRDLYSPYHAEQSGWFDWEHWDCAETILMRSPSERLFQIWGNTTPQLSIMARGDTKFLITNGFGEFTYDFGDNNGTWIYMDTSSKMALRKKADNTIEPYVGTCNIPRFEYFENRVRVISGEIVVGLTPRWIN